MIHVHSLLLKRKLSNNFYKFRHSSCQVSIILLYNYYTPVLLSNFYAYLRIDNFLDVSLLLTNQRYVYIQWLLTHEWNEGLADNVQLELDTYVSTLTLRYQAWREPSKGSIDRPINGQRFDWEWACRFKLSCNLVPCSVLIYVLLWEEDKHNVESERWLFPCSYADR